MPEGFESNQKQEISEGLTCSGEGIAPREFFIFMTSSQKIGSSVYHGGAKILIENPQLLWFKELE